LRRATSRSISNSVGGLPKYARTPWIARSRPVLVVAAAIYVPLGRELTGTEALGPFELGVVLALAGRAAGLARDKPRKVPIG
jgi:hypothetical protein